MKNIKIALVLLGLVMLGWSGQVLAESCSKSCPNGTTCTLTAAPGNTLQCWVSSDCVVCREYNPYGTLVRNIVRQCNTGGSIPCSQPGDCIQNPD